MKKSYRMQKAAAPKQADIYLYDVIGGDFWADGTTAKDFAADLKALGDMDVLNIFVNSPGGSVFEGTAIYNTLVRNRAKKIVNIDGVAASIASVICMAGDQINIAKNGLMMIHNASGAMQGHADDFRKAADVLDKISETICETYADRADVDAATVQKWMDDETWFNADEACAAGLADKVNEQDLQVAALLDTKSFFNRYRHVPSRLARILATVLPPKRIHNATTPFHDLPLADRERPWDANAADGRIRKWASTDGSGDKDKMVWAKYSQAFFWDEGAEADREHFQGYKLGFADIIDDKLTAVPRGVFAAAGVMNGARGGVDIPEADEQGVKDHIAKYYEKMKTEFKDDSIEVPWKKKADKSALSPTVATVRARLEGQEWYQQRRRQTT